MKTRLILSLFAAMPLMAVTCPSGTTHIVDTLLMADRVTPLNGKILAKGPSSPLGSILSTTLTIPITPITIAQAAALVPNVDFCLVGGPAVKYATTYLLTTAAGKATDSYSEPWFPPNTTNTLAIRNLWGGSSAPQYFVSPQQINPSGLLPGQTWVWDGTSFVPGTGGGGGGSTGDGTWGGGPGTVATWGGI